ncbi:MAG TPA: filamentous hemagglutinin N-terminal domain-containing protein, partial [Burkholderiales bacterium]
MPKNKSTPFSARKRLIVVAISACFTTAPAWANPTGPQVVNGSASIAQTGNLLTVTNSNGAIINWNTFSIAAGETTRFNQPSVSSSVLNRVLLPEPSVLLGTLSSNGRVWLVNSSGIVVGPGARIDVAAFIASTLPVRNEDFLAGRLNFQATPNAGKVENYGQITTPSGGSVYLVAPNVENHGTITAPNGEVILVAGQRVELIDTGTPGVKVEVVGAEGNATNLGSIVSEAGRIGIAGVLVKNSGTLNASSLVNEGGRVFLKASQDAYVDGSGRIVATGTKGGSIEVLGNRVAVMDQAQLDASGNTGGGSVLVGGDYQGKNPDVQNANITYFGPQASIKADATQNGDGGKVIVWADDTTR